MNIYNYTHKIKGTGDMYDKDNVIFSIHKRGKQKTLPYTIYRKIIKENENIDMSYHGLHYIICHIKLPEIKCKSGYTAGWDYDEIIDNIKISFNNTVMEEKSLIINKLVEFNSNIQQHVYSFKIPTFYTDIHDYFPLFLCNDKDILKHDIKYNLNISKILIMKNSENNIVNFHENMIQNNIPNIKNPLLECYYVNFTDLELEHIKDDNNKYIVNRTVEIETANKKIYLHPNKIISKLLWYSKSFIETSTLNINSAYLFKNLQDYMTKKYKFHEYDFNMVNDTKKYRNSVIVKNGHLDLNADQRNKFIVQYTETTEFIFNKTDKLTELKIKN